MQSAGVPLYSGYFDHKGPVHHWVYQCGYFIAHSLWGIWVVESLIFLVALSLLYRGTRRFAGRNLAVLGCLVAMCINRYPFYPESLAFELSLAALGTLLLCHEKTISWFAMGALAGTCLFIKQTCIGFFVGVGTLCCLQSTQSVWRKRIVLSVLGASLLVAGVSLVLVANGNFKDFLDCCWLFNIRYSTYVSGGLLGRVLTVLQTHFLLLAIASMSLLLLRNKAALAMLLFLAFELFMLAKAGRFHWYQNIGVYFAASVPVVYLVSQGLVQVVSRAMKIFFFCSAFLVCGGAEFVSGFGVSIVDSIWLSTLCPHQDPVAEISAYINKLPPAKLVVWGSACDLYLKTGRESPLAPYYYFNPVILNERLQDAKLDVSSDEAVIVVDVESTNIERIETVSPTRSCALLNSIRTYVKTKCRRIPFSDSAYRVYVPGQLLLGEASGTDK